MRAYLSLGSNQGDRAALLAEAVARLARAGVRPLRVSTVYETEPQGLRQQPWFLNCVLEAETSLSPRGLLEAALAVEQAMGRVRTERWGPRIIDIDLLLYEDLVLHEPDLTLPHPRLHERAFALVPLAELAPQRTVGRHGSIADLAARRQAEQGQRLRPWGALPQAGEGLSPPATAPLAEEADAREPQAQESALGAVAAGGRRARAEAVRQAILLRLAASAGSAVSGAALAQELGMSRTAVWKWVQQLRRLGYPIAAGSGQGYALAADAAAAVLPLRVEDLRLPEAQVVGRALHLLQVVDSTNRLARDLGLQGAPEGTTVVADQQTAGRGRAGRTFLSPMGGVYISVILRPRLLPTEAVRLTLLAAVAVCSALRRLAGVPATIKWPNDVLLPAGKVSGILLEMVAAEDQVDLVILGCGINVVTVPPVDGACSLWSAGSRVGRGEVARAVLQELDAAYAAFRHGQWPELLARWRELSATLGQEVRVSTLDGRQIQGRALDVTTDGALQLQTAQGLQTILAGDVQHLRPWAREHARC